MKSERKKLGVPLTGGANPGVGFGFGFECAFAFVTFERAGAEAAVPPGPARGGTQRCGGARWRGREREIIICHTSCHYLQISASSMYRYSRYTVLPILRYHTVLDR